MRTVYCTTVWALRKSEKIYERGPRLCKMGRDAVLQHTKVSKKQHDVDKREREREREREKERERERERERQREGEIKRATAVCANL